MKKLVLIGAGGMGREVAELVEIINASKSTYELLGFLDDGEQFAPGVTINGYLWLGKHDWAAEHKDEAVFTCTIGDAVTRAKMQEELSAQGVRFETICAPDVRIPKTTTVGDGCVFTSGVGISVNCTLGKGVFLNGGVSIGHDTVIGNYTAMMTRTSISGNCKIGEQVNIGGHAFVIPGRKIGDRATIAAGSVVFTNVKAGSTVLGNPAKRMRKLE